MIDRQGMKKIEYMRHQTVQEKKSLMDVYYKNKKFRDQGNIFLMFYS